MGTRIAVTSILICCVLAPVASALNADDYIIAGRARLFAGTAAGLAEASDIFEAGLSDLDCSTCPVDGELMLLYAVTRTATLFVDHNDVLASEDFLGLADAFGVPLVAIAPFCTEMDIERAGPVVRSQGVRVDDKAVRDVLEETVIPELAGIIEQLNSIDNSAGAFVVYLAPEETGLPDELEIDYGDVLVFKGLLLAYKGVLLAQMARDVHDLVLGAGSDAEFPGAGLEAIQGASSLPAAFSVVQATEGDEELLAQARADCVEALTTYLGALESIAAENHPAGADPQDNEFVYIDPEAYAQVGAYRQTLDALRRRLADGTASSRAGDAEIYAVYGVDSVRFGELILILDGPGAGGRQGRLVLDDGAALEVDWCTDLGNGEIGVSLFDSDQNREGWLEGAIDLDHHVIQFASLEVWGGASEDSAEEDSGAFLPPHVTLEWLGGLWSEQVKGFVAASQSWFASAQRTGSPGLD